MTYYLKIFQAYLNAYSFDDI